MTTSLRAAERLVESDPAAAATIARDALSLNSSDAAAYRLLGAALRRLGQDDEANKAELSAIDASATDLDLQRASQALKARDFATSEALLRAILRARPTDVTAIQMLGEIAAAAGLLEDAEALHRRALSLAPGFEYARLHLANVLNGQSNAGGALGELREIKGEIREFEGFKMLLADTLSQVGECAEALDIYRAILARDPNRPDLWSRVAFLLNASGNTQEAIDTCRLAVKALPRSGRAWWALADMKTYRFSDEDIETISHAVADPSIGEDDRLQLHFALGKALEDRGDFKSSFENYRRGNELSKTRLKYNPDWTSTLLERIRQIFTREFFEFHGGKGNPAPDPIFIVGMPRSGSTLVEQVLASHPLIEGTAELPVINTLAISLEPERRAGDRNIRYLDRLKALSPTELTALGSAYLDRTRVHRKTDRPFFVDKMPSNWAHIGFIKLILPNSKIIDVRRHPLDCGFSNYKHLFGRGQQFSYNLTNIGAYYRDYVAVMAHFDFVAPGMTHRLVHDQLVADPEREIRRLLEFVGVPFDEACLRFHETERPVLTPSSQQVRQPLRPDFVDQWRPFEGELTPLKEALGPALEHWGDPQPQ